MHFQGKGMSLSSSKDVHKHAFNDQGKSQLVDDAHLIMLKESTFTVSVMHRNTKPPNGSQV